jgi:hypothetical protein
MRVSHAVASAAGLVGRAAICCNTAELTGRLERSRCVPQQPALAAVAVALQPPLVAGAAAQQPLVAGATPTAAQQLDIAVGAVATSANTAVTCTGEHSTAASRSVISICVRFTLLQQEQESCTVAIL